MSRQSSQIVRSKVLRAAAKMFIESGYEKTSIAKMAEAAQVNRGSLCFVFKDKESILCELVSHVLQMQFDLATELLGDKASDKILFYAVETILQLHIAESSEQMREMYNVSYSMPNCANVIYRFITARLEAAFSDRLPDWETKDFYEREIAAAGIMRNFMSVPCDLYFTMDRKIRAFLESTFLLFRVPDEKIAEVIAFVETLDWDSVIESATDRLPEYFDSKL